MTKKTLLQMVQNILSDMDSDEVNSISDTVESLQVAEIVRETYEYLVATLSFPERRDLVRLDALTDVNRPNHLKIPSGTKDVIWLRYKEKEVTFLKPEDFFRQIFLAESLATFTVLERNNVSYKIRNDQDPTYWTNTNDKQLIFDSWDEASESTLTSSNSLAYVNLDNEFLLEDNFTPDLDANLFPMLLNEAKNAAFVNLKQVSNSVAQERSRKSLVRAQNELYRTTQGNPADRLPDYGRRR